MPLQLQSYGTSQSSHIVDMHTEGASASLSALVITNPVFLLPSASRDGKKLR